MVFKESLFAFALGVTTVAAAHTMWVQVAAQSEEDAVVVCANPDGVMRQVGTSSTCPAGDRRIVLKPPKYERPCEQERKPDLAALGRRLDTLEGRNNARLLDRTAKAPFHVTNEAGINVFSVETGSDNASTTIANAIGAPVARIGAYPTGGDLSVMSGSVRPATYSAERTAIQSSLFSFTDRSGLDVVAGAMTPIRLSKRDGTYALAVSLKGNLLAALGESTVGSGLAVVNDTDGSTRASVHPTEQTGPGIARIIDGDGKTVAALSATGPNGSGLLQLRNNADVVMVEAGMLPSGIGAVRAGPGAFQHGLGFVGLPASYIEGKK